MTLSLHWAAAVLWMLPKAMAFMATNPGDLWDYIVGESGKGQPMQEKTRSPLYVLQQPQAPVLKQTNGASSAMMNEMKKIGFGGWDELFPVLSIIDPELMKTVLQNLRHTKALTHYSTLRNATFPKVQI